MWFRSVSAHPLFLLTSFFISLYQMDLVLYTTRLNEESLNQEYIMITRFEIYKEVTHYVSLFIVIIFSVPSFYFTYLIYSTI